jgi:di/tricarboxylate transporter
LLVQGTAEQLDALRQSPDFILVDAPDTAVYRLGERLVALTVPSSSSLVGRTILESRLGDAFDLSVLGIVRRGQTRLMPAPSTRLEADDKLLVEGKEEDLATLRALQGLEIDEETRPTTQMLASARAGLVEVVLSPHTTLVGKTLRQLHFRDKYQLNVLAIWRGGRAYRANLRDMELRFGDALLVLGSWDRLRLLADTPDFIPLAEELQETPRQEKAPLAAFLMAGVIVLALTNWLPIAIAAVVGATLMILTGCLSMDEAYRQIEWRAVFLIAGMLPLGIAMDTTGAARYVAELVVGSVGGLGLRALLAMIFLLTMAAAQVMPSAVVAVLMAPIAIETATDMGLSPYALVMTVAVAASASFLSPVGHPANVLIMGPGGYRFSDYIKVGFPLALVVFLVTMLVLPLVWPLR